MFTVLVPLYIISLLTETEYFISKKNVQEKMKKLLMEVKLFFLENNKYIKSKSDEPTDRYEEIV